MWFCAWVIYSNSLFGNIPKPAQLWSKILMYYPKRSICKQTENSLLYFHINENTFVDSKIPLVYFRSRLI